MRTPVSAGTCIQVVQHVPPVCLQAVWARKSEKNKYLNPVLWKKRRYLAYKSLNVDVVHMYVYLYVYMYVDVLS